MSKKGQFGFQEENKEKHTYLSYNQEHQQMIKDQTDKYMEDTTQQQKHNQ